MAYDVLLTYPREKVNAFYNMIPAGLASIAAVLEQNNLSVKIIDFNFYSGDFRIDLVKWKPKVIGIGGTTPTRKGSFLTARLSKEMLPDVPTVYGGVHASFTAEDTLKHIPEIDYIIKGEGEWSFLALCRYFIHGIPLSLDSLSGLSYRNDGGFVHNPAQRIDHLDDLPLPARHLFGEEYSLKLDFLNIPADFIITSRGCTVSCVFCSASRMFPGGVRCRGSEHIQSEIEMILSRRKVEGLKLFDSTFTSSKKHVHMFCDMIKPYHLKWECEVRADSVDYDLLKRMKDAGCCYIDVGLETTDEVLLENCHKRITVKDAENVLYWSKQLNIRTKVFFIFGHPGQTIQSCFRDVKYIRKNRSQIDFYSTTIGMRIYPGTKLEKRARQMGFIPDTFSWAHFKPSKWNYLIYEFDDQFVLYQKQLNYFGLFLIFVLLVLNGTIGSLHYIRELFILNVRRFIRLSGISFKHTVHRFSRRLRPY